MGEIDKEIVFYLIKITKYIILRSKSMNTNHFKKINSISIIIFLLPFVCSMSNSFATKYAGEFLSLGVGARPLGMGGAFVSISDDPSGIFWNPAGIASASSREVLFMHAATFGNLVKYDYIAAVFPHKVLLRKKANLGLGLIRLGIDDIPYTNETLIDLNGNGKLDPEDRLDYTKVKKVSDSEWAFFFSYSHLFRQNILIGGNGKVVYKTIGSNSAYGLGVDIGILYHQSSLLSFGANLQDATTTFLSWNTGTTEIILPTLKTGFSLNKEIEKLYSLLSLSVDADFRFEGRKIASQYSYGKISADTHLGAELIYKKTISVRLGSDIGKFSTGGGIIYKRFRVDYAFLGDDELGNSHRVSGSIRF